MRKGFALVTGGNGGIARSIVEELTKTHHVLAPGRDELDVSRPDSITRWLDENGIPEVLVNAAGTIHAVRVQDSNPDEWIRDISVNLVGPYLLCRALVRAGDGTIINIASTAGYAAYKEWSSYCASKAALIKLTKSLAEEGVRAYSISPGATDTKFRDGLGLPNNRLQSPDVIAGLVRDILEGKYSPGDDVFVRLGELEVR